MSSPLSSFNSLFFAGIHPPGSPDQGSPLRSRISKVQNILINQTVRLACILESVLCTELWLRDNDTLGQFFLPNFEGRGAVSRLRFFAEVSGKAL